MYKPTCSPWKASFVLLAAILGCVELTGQRITWFHDVEKDEFRILLHYDGVHESVKRSRPNGSEQIPKFIAGGDWMLLDWYGHIDMADVRMRAKDPNVPDIERDWARLLTSIRTEPVGYYREPDGRVGAAQLITIPKVSEFLRKLNGLINRKVLAEAEPVAQHDPMARTKERILAAAKQGHTWVSLDGQAIRVTIPVQPGEWAREKGKGLNKLARGAAEALAGNGDLEKQRGLRFTFQLLTSLPVSYLDRGDSITVIVGTLQRSGTLRAAIRDEYEPSLEALLMEHVGIDLDAELTAAELGGDGNPPPGIAAVFDFGPPEEPIRALLRSANNGCGNRQSVLKKLRERAIAFNRAQGVPPAPEADEDSAKYLAAWKDWYAQIKRYPLVEEDESSGEK